MFRFNIDLHWDGDGFLTIKFTQVFTSVSEEGNAFLARYEAEDFAERLKKLEGFMIRHLGKRQG
jgi:hypothetical protein